MKNLLFLCLFALFATELTAQVNLGIRAGVSTPDVQGDAFNVFDGNGVEELKVALNDARYGVFAGLLLRIELGQFLIQPEVIFNSNRLEYEVTDLQGPDLIGQLKEEKYQYLDIPLMLGAKLGVLRLQGGPVGHVYINSTSELTDFANYEQKFKEFTFGYQAGLGLDLWKFMIDVRYEGNFSKYGDHFLFNGEEYKFDQRSSRLLFSVGFLFSKK